MGKKFFFLVGTLVVSLALVPLGTAKQNEETKDTFEDIFNAADNDDLFTTSSDQEDRGSLPLHFRRDREKPLDLPEPRWSGDKSN